MPYARHLRVTAIGVMAAPPAGTPWEQFSYRVNLSLPPDFVTGDAQMNRFQDMANDVQAFHLNPACRIGQAAILREVKVAEIGPLGTYLSNPVSFFMDQPGGGAASIQHAPQVALAVSLGTARRGPTGKGRFYLPLPIFGLNSADGRIAAADAQAVAQAVRDFVANLNNAPGIDGVAPKVTVASSKGYNTDVTEVRVGRTLDTIRSRRTSILEAYGVPIAV